MNWKRLLTEATDNSAGMIVGSARVGLLFGFLSNYGAKEMATQQLQRVCDNSTLANYKAWAQPISGKMTSDDAGFS
jgi:hypothetical protein